MADVLVKPAFQSAVADSGDATKLGPTAWNAARLFSGGSDGEILSRDSASATGASWVVPSVVTAASLGLGNVENVALSTWAGSANLTTLGTLAALTVSGWLTGANLMLAQSGSVVFGVAGAMVNVLDGQFRFRNNTGTAQFDFAHDHVYLSHQAGGNAIIANGAGIFLFANEAQTIGFTLNGATADVCKIRNRANSGYATMDALGYAASGVAGASGTFSSVTVVNGIVTAGT